MHEIGHHIDNLIFTLHFATINTIKAGLPKTWRHVFTLHFATINTKQKKII